jgi:cell division septation protein DedD
MQFSAEAGSPPHKETPVAASAWRRHRWMIGTAAAVLVVAASIGAPVWLIRVRSVDDQGLTVTIPSSPARTLRQPVPLPRPLNPFSPELQNDRPVPTASDVPAARTTAPEPRGAYTILVASFQSRDRAERVVDELVNAGYGAHAVDRSGGANGPWVQVQISGYTSAIDVQRDLQRIRELPGGFGDARVVEQN